nr:hypothetical protein [Bacteroidota bacterium]
VVNGHILAHDKGKNGERYILGGTNTSYRQFFSTLSVVTAKKHRLYSLPLPMMLAFSGLQLGMAKTFGLPPLITPPWVKRYMYNWSLSSGKAERELGYKYTTLQEGMAKTINWLEASK